MGAQRGTVVNFRVKSAAGRARSAAPPSSRSTQKTARPRPQATKRFWSPCGDGTQYRVYVRQYSEKLWAITVERYVRLVVTSTVGLKKYTIS